MIDFSFACEVAFNRLAKNEVVFKLDESSKKNLKLPVVLEVWEVLTEILINDKCREIKLHILLLPEFPYVFPKILLSPKDFENFKYIPHVDNERVICTFDPDLTRPDPNQSGEVLIETIRKAKQILEDGINKRNQDDFFIEFRSYWDQQYADENNVNKFVLSLIEKPIGGPVTLLILEKPLKEYKYILHKGDEIAKRFTEFLEVNKFTYQESEVLILQNLYIEKHPPFALKNYEIIEKLKNQNELLKKYISYINSRVYPKLVLISQDDIPILIGWFHKPLNINRKGFRPGKISNFYVLSTFQKNDFVNRILPEILTMNRLKKRSDGSEYQPGSELRLGVAGIGSLGSNLIFFLNTFDKPELRLIDSDDLKIENTGRHFLGFEYTGLKKTLALKSFLQLQTPLQKITSRENSIINVCQKETDYINQLDFLFVCIGKTNIEKWIGQAIESGLITIPVFFLWVEPYLAGGHCLYIYPGSKSFNSYFDEDDFFLNNVISKKDYENNNPLLKLKEASCQTSFVPYSSFSVVMFLSNLFPIISEIITHKKSKSKSYSWIGNIQYVIEMGIELSSKIQMNNEGQIIET